MGSLALLAGSRGDEAFERLLRLAADAAQAARDGSDLPTKLALRRVVSYLVTMGIASDDTLH
ncbi:hypothetical protein VI08_09430 [Luteibacter yeojuensis]|uniref:Uncharacterized protein n=2 Tax=Luteibacter yeojuensis TaxID=345309 RepID=A0A0F3KV08_9GAMM|nr:hypothetical protein VI08_09430 [Luteibacter yeojuensis]